MYVCKPYFCSFSASNRRFLVFRNTNNTKTNSLEAFLRSLVTTDCSFVVEIDISWTVTGGCTLVRNKCAEAGPSRKRLRNGGETSKPQRRTFGNVFFVLVTLECVLRNSVNRLLAVENKEFECFQTKCS